MKLIKCIHRKGLSKVYIEPSCEYYLQVVVLSFLLSFQVQTCQSAQILFAHSLVHGGATTDSLTVVVGGVGPPVSLGLHVAQDHVLNGSGQAWHLK